MSQHPIDIDKAFVYISSTCPTCFGVGKVQLESVGTMPTASTCAPCAGTGITSLPMSLQELAKAILPVLFPPTETPPPILPVSVDEATLISPPIVTGETPTLISVQSVQ